MLDVIGIEFEDRLIDFHFLSDKALEAIERLALCPHLREIQQLCGIFERKLEFLVQIGR